MTNKERNKDSSTEYHIKTDEIIQEKINRFKSGIFNGNIRFPKINNDGKMMNAKCDGGEDNALPKSSN